jgi:hypothetical protein
MHKSYQSTLPSSNKILQKKWDEKYYSEHRILVIELIDLFNNISKNFLGT